MSSLAQPLTASALRRRPARPAGLTLVFVLALVARAADPAFPVAEATLDDLQARLAAGTLTSRDLTAAYLARISQIDHAGPRLRSVIAVNPEALEIAARLDAERKAGRVRGPLHGIPVLIKDNLDTADRLATTAGSLALVGHRPPRDAHAVTLLREAGAVILGKTNLSEWANYRGQRSTSGWSARGGQTLNPYALDRNPSGSSSGSAVAVAANLCAVAVGTETNGSILSPASVCGIVGVKPTVGLVSRAGIIPISASQDTAGPMTRTVRDAALLLAALAGADARDPATQGQPAALAADLSKVRADGALRGTRLGVVRGPFGFHPRFEARLDELVRLLRSAGAEVVDPVKIPTLAKLSAVQGDLLSFEFKDGLNRYLAEPGRVTPIKTLAEAIAFNEAHRTEELLFFGQELFTAAQARGPLTEQAYLDVQAACRRLARDEGIDAALSADRLDALVMLTVGPAAPTDPVNGGSSSGYSPSLAAVAGYPSVTVPALQVFGLPVGLSFVGRAWSDARLLSLAADFEHAAHARRPPRFLPTVELR
jgi:amidase